MHRAARPSGVRPVSVPIAIVRRVPRLFIAISIPHPIAQTLLDRIPLSHQHAPLHWRLVSASNLHLTLHFLGETDLRRLDDITESVERSAAGLRAFRLTADRLACLPELGEPRVLTALTDAPPDMLEIQRRAFHRLATREQRKRGNRFKPHLTLARSSDPDAPRLPETPIEPVAISVSEIQLFRSDLRPDGSHYTLLHTVPLRPSR